MSIDYFSASPTSFQEALHFSPSSASSTPYLSPYAARSSRSSSVPSEAEADVGGDGGPSTRFRSNRDGEGDETETDEEGDVTMGDGSGYAGTPGQVHGGQYGLGLGLGGGSSGDMDMEEDEVNRSFESAMSVFNSPFSMRGSPVGGKTANNGNNESNDNAAHLLSARRNGQLAAYDTRAQTMLAAGSPMRGLGMGMGPGGALFGSSSSRIRKQGAAAGGMARDKDEENLGQHGVITASPSKIKIGLPGRSIDQAGTQLQQKLLADSNSGAHGFTLSAIQSTKENNIFSGGAPIVQPKLGSASNVSAAQPKMASSGHGFGARQRGFGRESSRGNMGAKSAVPSTGLGLGAMSAFQAPRLGEVTMSRDPSVSSLASNASASSSSSGLMLPPPNPLRRKSQDRMTPEEEADDASEDMFGQNMMRIGGPSISKPSKKARMGLPPTWKRDGMVASMDDRDDGLDGESRTQPVKGNGNMLFRPSPRRADSMPSPGADTGGSPLRRNNKSFVGDLMDVDSPYRTVSQSLRATSTPKPTQTPGSSMSASPGLGDFFCDSPSANAGKVGGFGRMKPAASATADSSPESGVDSPSSLRPGPVSRLMEKSLSTNAPGLFGSGRPGGNVSSRRTQPYKRPMLAPLAPSSDNMLRPSSTASALPILQSGNPSTASGMGLFKVPALPRSMAAPMRRAVSVCDQGASASGGSDPSEEEDENGSPSVLAGQRAVSHFEVGPGAGYHQPIQHVGGRITPDNAYATGILGGKKVSPTSQAGFLGFGENEMEGKILPCHRVKEDGLVRITHDTLRSLLSGEYKDQMQRYHVIDCRFDYEYEGGHIDGAVNVHSTTAVEELLLKIGRGVYDQGGELPEPSRSGEELSEKPIVLVFHCEFSNKRAPAFAKHLRSRDRTLNNHTYPKVYYPELYILEGGYCGFFGQCPDKCEPSAYVPMDDPKHFERRDSDLHDFRKFTRTRSFTYGEQQPSASARSHPPPTFGVGNGLGGSSNAIRMSAPQGLAAPRLAIQEEEDSPVPLLRLEKGRLSQLSRSTNDSGADTDDENSGLDNSGFGDSPCARPSMNSGLAPGIFGSTKSRVMGRPGLGGSRGAFSRVASYAGTTSAGSTGSTSRQ